MKIRPCKKSDLVACQAIFALPELATASGDFLRISYLEKFLSQKYFLVAVEKEKIIGAIYGEKLKAGGTMMWALAVHPDYRGKKVGTSLMRAFEKNAKADGRAWIVLHASTKTKRTVKFYEKLKYDIGNHYIECAKDF